MAKEQSGVKNYDRLRRYLDVIYLYSFFSRDDFQQFFSGSPQNFDFCLRILKDIFPEMNDGVRDGKYKYLMIDRAGEESDEDRLANTYFLATISDEELVGALELLRRFSSNPDRAAVVVAEQCDDAAGSTTRRRIDALAKYGYLETDRHRRYHLRKNRLSRDRLSNEELQELHRYVRFAENITYPRVPGRFLQRSVERELLRRGLTPETKPMFRFLNSPNRNAFDEDIVFQLLDIIRARKTAVFETTGGEATELPVRVRVDTRLGRWYVLTMAEHPAMRRISNLRSVRAGSAVSEEAFAEAEQQVKEAFRSACFSSRHIGDAPVTVEAELLFDMPGLQRQFQREFRIGELCSENGKTFFRAVVNDPVELVPLLRAYAPWLRLTENCGGIRTRICDDLLLMRQRLEEVGNDASV